MSPAREIALLEALLAAAPMTARNFAAAVYQVEGLRGLVPPKRGQVLAATSVLVRLCRAGLARRAMVAGVWHFVPSMQGLARLAAAGKDLGDIGRAMKAST